MRVLLIMMLAVTPAFADTADETACEARIARAPNKVRVAIEARLGVESRCATLEVRVVPMRRGFYVFATAPNGQVFEDTVRNPGQAGELIVKWAQLEPRADPDLIEIDPVHRVAAVEPVEALDPVAVAAPAPEPELQAPAPASRSARTIALGGVATASGYGMRGEVDVVGGTRWTLGVAIARDTMRRGFQDDSGITGDFQYQDLRAVAFAAHTSGRGGWRLRIQAGFGVIRSGLAGDVKATHGYQFQGPVESSSVFGVAEAAISVARDLGAGWAIAAGPVATLYQQTTRFTNATNAMLETTRDYGVVAFAALRRQL